MASQQEQREAIYLQVQPDGPVHTTNNLKLDEPLSAFFSKGVPVVNIWLLASFVVKMRYHKVSMVSWCSIVFLTSLALSSIIHMVVLSTSKCIQRKVQLRCKLAYLSTLLRMLAAAALLLFLDAVHTVVVLPLLLVVLALVTFFCWQTFDSKNVLGINWGEYKAELKLRFDLSAQIVSMAFTGLSGTVIGYVKVSSNLIGGSGYMGPECFLFYSFVLGLLVVLLSTVPSRIDHMQTRSRMAKVYMRTLAYGALLCLVLAGVMASEDILREYVFFACFTIMIVAVLCFFWENHYGGHQFVPEQIKKNERNSTANNMGEPNSPEAATREQEDANKFITLLHGSYFTSMFAALMAAHSTYGTETGSGLPLSMWFKGFLFFALCSILHYAVRMVVFAELPDMKSSAPPKEAWSWATYATMASTAIFAVLVGYLHPEEVISIF